MVVPISLRRILFPACSSALAIFLAIRLSYPLPHDAAMLLWISRLDPLLLLSALRWERLLPHWAWLPLSVLLVSALAGRLFCGWFCPIGGLLNLLQSGWEFLDNRSGIQRLSMKKTTLSRGRYLWLAFMLLLLLLGGNWPLLLTPYALLSHEINRAWTGQIPWLLTAMLLLGIFLYPRFWCVTVCPTGLLLSAVGYYRRWRYTSNTNCNRCGRCQSVCPVHAAHPGKETGEQCLLCGRCHDSCPARAVSWTASRRNHADSLLFSQSRRKLIRGSATMVAATCLWLYLGRRALAHPLRPPGALPETEFLERCARCARCIKVCPNQALQPAPLSAGLNALDTPQLVLRKGRCELCLLCQEVCPTGAIRQLPPGKVKIGTAILDHANCLAWQLGKYCLICVEQCPFHAVQMDENQRPLVIAANCVGCGACENGCPVDGAAIHVYP